MSVVPYVDLIESRPGMKLLFERIPDRAWRAHPIESLRAERDLHMDMLRESGPRSDAHIARYQLALDYARTPEYVLDAACGMGYGSAILASQLPDSQVVGLDVSTSAIKYATDCFLDGRPNLEFSEADLSLRSFYPHSRIDMLVSFETIEHLLDPARFLAEASDLMPPGSVIIASVPNRWVDETGKDPNPDHLHVFDFETLRGLLSSQFEVLASYRQNAERGIKGDYGRILRPVSIASPSEQDILEAEWWILVGRKSG
jgi:2-polyprenyl-3-methyl-5-hydroxy-6-metoxy-1,4-benzoquinol methylase